MGYRSVVVLAVKKEARPHLMHFLGGNPEAMALAFKHHDIKIEDFQGVEGSIMFQWDSIKWYDSFPDVKAIEAFMEHMGSESIEDAEGNQLDGDECFRFVRTGEEYDDIEQRGWAFDIYPSVGIDY